MMSVKVDATNAHKKLRAMRENGIPAAEEAARVMGGTTISAIIALIRAANAIDTGRYIRSWQMSRGMLAGGNGGDDASMKPLRKSGRSGQYRKRLAAEIVKWNEINNKWAGIVELYESSPDRPTARRWNQYKKAVRTKQKVEDIYAETKARYREFLSSNSAEVPSIIIGAKRIKRESISMARLTQVHAKIFGGYAHVRRTSTGAMVIAASREPHAKIVEYGLGRKSSEVLGNLGGVKFKNIPARRFIQRALAATKSHGITFGAADAYLRRVTSGTGTYRGTGMMLKLKR